MPHQEDVAPETEAESTDPTVSRAQPGAFQTAPKFSPLPEDEADAVAEEDA